MEFDLGFVPSLPAPNIISDVTGRAAATLARMQAKVRQPIISALSQGERSLAAVKDGINRQLGTRLTSQQRSVDRLKSKVTDNIEARIALGYAMMPGGPMVAPDLSGYAYSGRPGATPTPEGPPPLRGIVVNPPVIGTGGPCVAPETNPVIATESFFVFCNPAYVAGSGLPAWMVAEGRQWWNWTTGSWTIPPVSPPFATSGEAQTWGEVNGDTCCGKPPPPPTTLPGGSGTGPGDSCSNPLFIQICNPPPPPPPPSPTCDVPIDALTGQCPDGFEPDPNNPGCCRPIIPPPPPPPCQVQVDPVTGQCPDGFQPDPNNPGCCIPVPPPPLPTPPVATGPDQYGYCSTDATAQMIAGLQTLHGWEQFASGLTSALANLPFVGSFFASAAQSWQDAIQEVIGNSKCDPEPTIELIILRTILGIAEKYLGMPSLPADNIYGYYQNFACPTLLPDQSAINQMQLAGVINDDLWQTWTKAHGYCVTPQQLSQNSQRTRPGVQELLDLRLRNTISDDDLSKSLRERGVIDPVDASRYLDYLRTIPATSEFVSFTRGGMFDGDSVSRYYAGAGMPDALSFWLSSKGLNWSLDRTGPAAPGGNLPTAAQATWYASFQWPAPAQLLRAYWLLYDGRDTSWEPDWMQQLSVTTADLQAAYTRAGILPYFQNALAALSVKVPGIRQIRVMLRYNQATRAEIVDWLRREAYPVRIAEKYADALIAQEQERRNREAASSSKVKMVVAWDQGVINDQQLIDYLEQIGQSSSEAQQTLALAVIDRENTRIGGTIKSLKRAYLSGQVSDDQAISFLDQTGIDSSRANDYLEDWRVQKSMRRREVPAGRIVSDYVNGLLGVDDVVRRLRNLMYDDTDIQLLLNEAAYKIRVNLVKQAEALARKEKESQKEQEALIKQAEAAARQARSDLARHGSPKQIASWLCRGLVTDAEAYDRLFALGWPQEDANRLIVESCKNAGATTIADWVLKKIMPLETAIARMALLGWSESDALDLIASKEMVLSGKEKITVTPA